VWTFQTDEDRNQWTKVCDADWGEGYSSVMLGPSASGEFNLICFLWNRGSLSEFIPLTFPGRGTLFSGDIVTRLPPDGRIAYAGYANIKSKNKFKSFARVKVSPFKN